MVAKNQFVFAKKLGAASLSRFRLTTDHPQSCYGAPVLVDEIGESFGPGDVADERVEVGTEQREAAKRAGFKVD